MGQRRGADERGVEGCPLGRKGGRKIGVGGLDQPKAERFGATAFGRINADDADGWVNPPRQPRPPLTHAAKADEKEGHVDHAFLFILTLC